MGWSVGTQKAADGQRVPGLRHKLRSHRGLWAQSSGPAGRTSRMWGPQLAMRSTALEKGRCPHGPTEVPPLTVSQQRLTALRAVITWHGSRCLLLIAGDCHRRPAIHWVSRATCFREAPPLNAGIQPRDRRAPMTRQLA